MKYIIILLIDGIFKNVKRAGVSPALASIPPLCFKIIQIVSAANL